LSVVVFLDSTKPTFVAKVDDIVYELTPSAVKFLADKNAKSYFGTFAETLTTNFITPDALLECARPQEKKDIMSEHLEQNDEEVANNARHFMNHMNSQSYCCAESLPDALGLRDLSGPKTLLDVGGGSAIYTIEAVKSNPNLSGVVFELDNIKPLTEEFVDEAGLSGRITVCPGDFFTDEFPEKMNYVLFSNILHDWPDETNLELLKKSYNCLEPGGQVIISELLLDDDVRNSTSASTSMNIIMLPYTKVGIGAGSLFLFFYGSLVIRLQSSFLILDFLLSVKGRQYRPKELKLRLERLGFVNAHHKKLVDDYSLVIATKPN